MDEQLPYPQDVTCPGPDQNPGVVKAQRVDTDLHEAMTGAAGFLIGGVFAGPIGAAVGFVVGAFVGYQASKERTK